MIFTGRWNGHYNDSIKVSISVGDPKWMTPEYKIRDLAPYGIHGKFTGEIAKKLYFDKLNKIGSRGIKDLLKRAEQLFPNKNIILCCWEDVNKGEACHRRWLAEWLQINDGMILLEATEQRFDDNSDEPMGRKFDDKMEKRQVSIEELMAWA